MRPKKKFGQHFLTSPSIISKILHSSNVEIGDHVLEIGPGQGALTGKLVQTGAELTVVEIDADMRDVISVKYPSVRVVDADASCVVLSDLLSPEHNWKCVSNLPYNVGTRIVQNLLTSSLNFEGHTLMLQKEVGLRMLAKVGDRKRGSLSTFVQSFGRVTKTCLVPPGAFFPPPNVDSIVIHIEPYGTPMFSPCSLANFNTVNRNLFSQPRKAIRNSLKKGFSKEVVQYLETNSTVDFSLRPAQLTIPEVVDLVTALEKMKGSD